MRLVVWNCAGGIRTKWSLIENLQPDVAIVIECDQPDRVPNLGFDSSVWMGRLPHKGLGVFGFGDWKVEEAAFVEPQLEFVLPVQVSGPAEVELYAVWAMNKRASRHPIDYAGVRQPLAMMDIYRPGANSVIAGDYNNSVFWDTPRTHTFADMAARYEQEDFVSLYHSTTGEAFGSESAPTHWWRDRREDGKRYHIDYVFTSEHLASRSTLTVGTFHDSVTVGRSDHAYLVADIPNASRSADCPK